MSKDDVGVAASLADSGAVHQLVSGRILPGEAGRDFRPGGGEGDSRGISGGSSGGVILRWQGHTHVLW